MVMYLHILGIFELEHHFSVIFARYLVMLANALVALLWVIISVSCLGMGFQQLSPLVV